MITEMSLKEALKYAVYCIQGRRDVIPASGYTDVTIANGTQGMNRNDIIVRRYKKNESSEMESTGYAVIKGTPNAGVAVDPEVTTGDIRSGATLHEMALYRVKITGLNITAVEPMFNILKNMATLQKEFTELNSKIPHFYNDEIVLHYYSTTWLYAREFVGKEFAGCYPQATCLYINGQPNQQTTMILPTKVDSDGYLVIWAYGSGYVSGHMLGVSVSICK